MSSIREDLDAMSDLFVARNACAPQKTKEKNQGLGTSAAMLRSEDVAHLWRRLGVEPLGHELQGTRTLPKRSFLDLTEDIMKREDLNFNRSVRSGDLSAEEIEDAESRRIFRLFRRSREGNRVSQDSFEELLRACGIKDIDSNEIGELYQYILWDAGVGGIDEDRFVRFMQRRSTEAQGKLK
eukprot:g213.t1